jgi:hypothetical protein
MEVGVEDDPLVEVAELEAMARKLARNIRNPLDR